MKTAYLIHGWSGKPDDPILDWLKVELEQTGWTVVAPEMPDRHEPKIESWVYALNSIVKPSPDVVLVGHSVGCQAVMRYLAQTPAGTRIAGLVLIAPWMELDKLTIEEEGPESVAIAKPWVETPIDFAAVKARTARTVAVFSDDDPFVPLAQKELFERELGARTIVEQGMGHFSRADGIREVPSVLRAVQSCVTT